MRSFPLFTLLAARAGTVSLGGGGGLPYAFGEGRRAGWSVGEGLCRGSEPGRDPNSCAA